MVKRKWVFAVHNWETSDGYHHVSVGTGNRYKTKRFRKWTKAESYANTKAKEKGLKKYQVDTPSRPHKMVKVK